MKPLIGITADIDDARRFAKRYAGKKMVHLWDAYLQAVRDAGGVPVLLAPVQDSKDIDILLSRLDGLVISGGAFDVPPAMYGEKIISGAKVKPKPERAEFETKIILKAARIGLPILGICGGEQIINVAFGGSLFQDIRLQFGKKIRHESPLGKNPAMHEIWVEPDSLLARSLFARPANKLKLTVVNSYHHQAVKKVGNGLKISAVCASDGLVEAIESEKGFILGVQWHPERLYGERPEQLNLLKSFIKTAHSRCKIVRAGA